jgi:hypothetical protein
MAPEQNVPPAVISTASDTAPQAERIETEPVATEPIKAEPTGAEPALTAQEPAPAEPVAAEPSKAEPVRPEQAMAVVEPPPAPIEPLANIAATTPSKLENTPGNLTETHPESAAIVPEASPVETLDVEIRAKGKSVAKRSPSNAATARPTKSDPANRKAQPPQVANKKAVAALPKTNPAKAALAKPKVLPTQKQAATANSATTSKAPGFPAASPSTLFKPAPPLALANKAPDPTPAPEASFAPGDKPPGFEIQTNLGGGFFAMQPY